MFKFIAKIKNLFSKKTKKSEKNVLSSFIRATIYLTILLAPFFFLPLSSDPLEFSKILLFYLLVLIGMIAWFIQIVIRKEFDFIKTPFNFLVFIFGLVYLLAAIFSANRYNSFWGFSGHFSECFLTTFFFICFFFLIVNNLKSLKEAVKALVFFVISLALIMVFNFCQVFGLDLLARLGWPGTPLFNLLAGSIATLAVFLSTGVPLLLILLMLAQKSLDRIVFTVLLVVDLALIFIIAEPVGIISLIFGLFTLLFFIAWRVQKFSSFWLIIPIILIALSFVFLFLPLDNLLNMNIPSDIQLNGQTTWQVVKNTLADRFLFGVGPQNFYHAFAKYRPVEFNSSALWNFDFVSSGSHWLGQWATLGLLGGLVLFLLVFKYLLRGIWTLMKEQNVAADWFLSIGIFASWIVIFIAGFLLPFNFVLTFLFWFWLALGTIVIYHPQNKIHSSSFDKSGWLVFLSSLVLIILLVVGLGFLYFGGRTLAGEIYYTKASLASIYDFPASQNLQQAKDNLQQIKNLLNQAIKINPNQARYHLALAQALNQEMNLVDKQEELQNLAITSVAEADLGWRYSRGLAGYYRATAEILWPLQQILPQANTSLINAFKEAVALNPNHPYFHLTLGRIYLFGGQILGQVAAANKETNSGLINQATQYFQLASEEIKKAAQLKEDWAPARHYLALILEQEGKKTEAIAEMEEALLLDPNQSENNYELGRLYKDQGRLEEAMEILERAIQLDSYNLDAHLELIDIYESGGDQADKTKASEAIQRALKFFPQNKELQAKLEGVGKKK